MSIEETNVVDFISVDKASGEVVLTISDHLDWTDGEAHRQILQDKLNSYLAFVESGGLLESYANAKGRPVVFEVRFKFKPDAQGLKFLAKAKDVIKAARFELRLRLPSCR